MIKNYIKTAWRNIKKHVTFSLINAGGLTLGIASCLLLLLYVSYHLGYDHQFNNLNNVYIHICGYPWYACIHHKKRSARRSANRALC
jgi:hypothetical protein